MSNSHEDQSRNEFNDLEARLRSERPQLTALEQDHLKQRVLARVRRGPSRAARWGQTRWVGLGAALLVGVGATGGTLAATGGGAPQNAASAQYKPPKCNFEWHSNILNGGTYSPPGGTTCVQGHVSIDYPGNGVTVNPGTPISVGYVFQAVANTNTFTVTVFGPSVQFSQIKCLGSKGKPSAGSFTINMPSQAYSVHDANWYPGDTSSPSPSVYQGAGSVPNLCNGGAMSLGLATFSTST
jgi:hypothetical protein